MSEKLTTNDGRGWPRFRDGKPLFWRITGQEASDVLAAVEKYRECLSPDRRHLLGLFRPVVGIGSVGLRDYVVLLEGNGSQDPLFLQIKQEVKSAYALYLSAAHYENQGRRAAEGQRAIQPVSDLLLGWTAFGGHDFLVRQLNDHKGSIDLQKLKGGGLESLAQVAGQLLARGHARSGDACAIYGYCGKGDKIVKAIRDFASRYADQTEADYVTFMAALKAGTIGNLPRS